MSLPRVALQQFLGMNGARIARHLLRCHGQDVLTNLRLATVRSATSLLPFSFSSFSAALARPDTVTL